MTVGGDSTPHILVIKLAALGDFVQALGPCAAIRQHHKDARITLLTTAPFEDLARQSGYFDEVWLSLNESSLEFVIIHSNRLRLKS